MIIRLSESNDINQITALWHEAFGDGKNEIEFFLDNKYVPDNTLIMEEDGKIASMLFLLEGKMRINSLHYPSYYLYAACTAKEFRGRGFMAQLLEETNNIALSRNKDFICLMPGESSLFDFYEKHGYKTVFNKKILSVKRNDSLLSHISDDTDEIDFEELRNHAFMPFDFFEWDKSSVEFAFSHNKMYSGKAILSRKGYCLYSESDGVATVKEFAFTEQDFKFGIDLLVSSCNSDKFVINLPSQYKTDFGESIIVPSAMIYPVSNRAKSAVENLTDAYLGLTLD